MKINEITIKEISDLYQKNNLILISTILNSQGNTDLIDQIEKDSSIENYELNYFK